MKGLVKSTACALYKYSGAMSAHERLAHWAGRRSMSVVLFHRVTDQIPPDALTVSTAWFRDFCQLMRTRFNVVPLAEVHRLLMSQEPPPMRTVAITFDDCYRDNLAAAQVLAEHRLPATFFIPTRYIGSDHVFAWDADLPRMANLDWRDVAKMQTLGHEIASHSVSHPDMGMIGVEEARRELTDSKKTLEDKLQRPVRWFAYPYGAKSNFKPEYLPLVYDAGYQACFSAMRGFIEPTLRGQILPREAMPNFRSMTSLELYLSGVLQWYYGWKGRLGILS